MLIAMSIMGICLMIFTYLYSVDVYKTDKLNYTEKICMIGINCLMTGLYTWVYSMVIIMVLHKGI